MYKTKTIRRGTTALALLVSAAAVAGIAGTASAAPTGFATNQTVSVSSGTISTPFSFNLAPGSNACPGDTAAGGYRVQTFIASKSVNLSTLTFNASGPVNPGGGVYTSALYKQSDNARATGLATAPTSGNVLDSAFTMAPTSFSGGIPNGVYNIGIACSLTGATTRFWAHSITVSNGGTSFNWVLGELAAAPAVAVPTGASTDGGVITGTFTPDAAAFPAITSNTVTATPVGGGTAVNGVVSGTGYTISGLDNAVNYDVAVFSTNAVGNSPTTTRTNVDVSVAALPAVGSLAAVPGTESFSVSWTAPTVPAGANPLSYLVAVSGGPAAVAPQTVTTTSASFTGLTAGNYTVTVTATGSGIYSTGTPASVPAQANPSTILFQDITVVRPEGALVLTQRCGVNGTAEAYTDAIIGQLPVIPARPNSTVDSMPVNPVGDIFTRADGTTNGTLTQPQVGEGSAPTVVTGPQAPGSLASTWTGTADGSFNEYPYPTDNTTGVANAVYPTNCAINLGVARMLRSGPQAGNYFFATGTINQVTVANTQDIDAGWTLNGQVTDFVSTTDAGDKFSGNLLAWNPDNSYKSGTSIDGYNMAVTNGAVTLPRGVGVNTGLKAAKQPLGTSPAGQSLGIAAFDARLRLLIPTSADNGTYTGYLTFTAVNNAAVSGTTDTPGVGETRP
jgi:hypothetical protein